MERQSISLENINSSEISFFTYPMNKDQMLDNIILAKVYENMYSTFWGRGINWFKLWKSIRHYLLKFQMPKHLIQQLTYRTLYNHRRTRLLTYRDTHIIHSNRIEPVEKNFWERENHMWSYRGVKSTMYMRKH